MKTATRILLAAVLVASLCGAPHASAAGGAAAFEQLKSLIGHWKTQSANMPDATLDLELTSGGTAVLERSHMINEGKPVEMITLYYLDGEQLKLTHYCMAGNQPT